MKPKPTNSALFMLATCILVNLVAGNLITWPMTKKIGIPGRILLSVAETAVLVFVFRKYSMGTNTKIWKKLLAGFGAALVGQWLASISMGASNNPVGGVMDGALKGALPLFVLSALFVPFWLGFGLVNFVFLYFADNGSSFRQVHTYLPIEFYGERRSAEEFLRKKNIAFKRFKKQTITKRCELVWLWFETEADAVKAREIISSEFEFLPPWLAFPDSQPWNGQFRQGIGEDYLVSFWIPFYDKLTAPEKQNYLEKYPPSAEWQDWLKPNYP